VEEDESPAPAARPGVDRYGHRIGEQATMGLLDYLGAHAVDEDYAHVSEQRAARSAAGESATPPAGRGRIGLAGAAVMAVFAVLAVTAGLQTSRNAVADDRQRTELVGQVRAARAQVDEQNARLRALEQDTARLRTQTLQGDQASRALLARLRTLGTDAGTLAVRGEGVQVTADDAPGATGPRQMVLDTDLQQMANGFWEAGAEAIALNGQRLTVQSAIRLAGTAITVDNRSLRRPYVMTVIGDKDTLPARFAETTSGRAWLDLEREVGLRLQITPVSSLRLPAADEPSLRFANRTSGDLS
jgi:uncharacterized protein YlxW (UPF0749 family)